MTTTADRDDTVPAPTLDCPYRSAVFALRDLVLASEQFRHAVAQHFDAGLSDTMAMSHLSAAGSLTPRQLASKVGLTPATVTALLDRLERAGLAARADHPTDRRKTVVTLTEHGNQSLAQVRHWMTSAVSVFGPDQLPAVADVLSQLAAALNQQSHQITPAPPAKPTSGEDRRRDTTKL